MSRVPIRPALALVASVLAFTATAQAADRLLGELPPIKGESTLEGYRNWSDLSSLQWSAQGDVRFGEKGGTIAIGAGTAGDIAWSQGLDSTYTPLMGALLGGQSRAAHFGVVRLGGEGKLPAPYFSLDTEASGITSVHLSNSSVFGTLGAGTIAMTWDPAGLGQKGKKVTTTWNQTTQKVTTTGNVGATVPLSSTAPAATQGGPTRMYLRLGSGSDAIAGSSAADGYENWIAIDSVQFGGQRDMNAGPKGSTTSFDAPSFSELTWSQAGDATLPVVLGHLALGRKLSEATLEYVRATERGPETFMQMVMQDVYVTSLSVQAHDGGQGLVAAESIVFGSFSQTYWAFDDDGKPVGKGTTMGFDSVRQKSIGRILPTDTVGFGTGELVAMAAGAQVDAPPVATPVPEPGQWALLLAGLGLLVPLLRRRAGAA